MGKAPKRPSMPRDVNRLGKRIVEIATGTAKPKKKSAKPLVRHG
jgi:hypothetical protein